MAVMPSVLVLGAAGRLGRCAVSAFAANGWRVVAQRRPRAGRPAVPSTDGVTWIDADTSQPAELLAAAGPVDVVVHAMNPEYTAKAWQREAPVLMQQAIAIAQSARALLMFPGNVYNFGRTMPPVLRETTPQHPDTRKGAIRVALEQQLAQACAQGLRAVVIRAGDFFGGGSGTLLDLVIAKPLARGKVGLPGDAHTSTPYAYLPDLAETFERVARRRADIRGMRVFHFRGHELDGERWRSELQRIVRRPLRASRLPWWLIRLGGLVVPAWASIAEMRYLWTTRHALDNTQLVEFIGPEPHTPIDRAIRDALAAASIAI